MKKPGKRRSFFGIEAVAGQVWERKNGTTFIIDHCTPGYAHYWLAEGSKPQFRAVSIDRLFKNYKLVGGPGVGE